MWNVIVSNGYFPVTVSRLVATSFQIACAVPAIVVIAMLPAVLFFTSLVNMIVDIFSVDQKEAGTELENFQIVLAAY